MRIVIAGASGLLGSALVRALRAEDSQRAHDVIRLVRREKRADDELSWDPDNNRGPQAGTFDGVDAVVNLAGVGVGDRRWTASYKQQIRDSRLHATTLLADAVAAANPRPAVFLSGSAVGYYGDTRDQRVDENSQPGKDFLAQTCVEWEQASAAAAAAGTRTVLLRTGIVLTTKGGALGKVLRLFRAGLGARLGSGNQYVSWIARPDHIAALRFLLEANAIAGPVNVTAPTPVTNADYTKAIAGALHRPAFVVAPPPALRLVLGEFADTVVTGQRVTPTRLLTNGFTFGYPDIDVAVRELVAANA